MATEIERKFLVLGKEYRKQADGELYMQGYLSTDPERIVRVRIVGIRAFLTIKGKTKGCSCPEFEYEIPLKDAEQMFDSLCSRPLVEKIRYKVPYKGFIWEVDEFKSENEGLVVAEIELQQENEQFVKPDWIGKEVTGDIRYYNSYLSKKPFKKW